MLFMAASNVAENPFHAECLWLVEKLRKSPERTLPHSVLLKRMKMEAKVFHQLIDTLIQQGDINVITAETAGRPQRGNPSERSWLNACLTATIPRREA